MTDTPAALPGDIVQITAAGHKWLTAFVIVDVRKSWGIQGYAASYEANGVKQIYVRLKHAEYTVCGTAALVTADMAKQRQIAIETAKQIERERG